MTCGQCSQYNWPAPQYERNSMGSCQLMDQWIEKFNGVTVPNKEYDKRYAHLGGKIWMPYIERKCAKFTPVRVV